MDGTMKLNCMMQFSKIGKEGWGIIEFLGGKIFIDPKETGKFTGTGIIKEVELGFKLSAGESGVGFRVVNILNVVYLK